MYETTEWADSILTEDPLTREEEQQLFRIIQGDLPGKQDAIERLVVHNLKYAMRRANMWAITRGDVDDVFQEAVIGLISAAKKAKPSEALGGAEIPFVSYAEFWVKSYMQNYCSRMRGAVGVPNHVHADYKKFCSWEEKFHREHHRWPVFDEYIEAFDDSYRDRWKAVGTYRNHAMSLDVPLSVAGQDSSKSDVWKDMIRSEEDPAKISLDKSRVDLVESILEEYAEHSKKSAWSKTPRDLDIIRDKFGLNGRKELTVYELGEKHGVSAQMISIIVRRFLNVVGEHHRFSKLREEAWNNISS